MHDDREVTRLAVVLQAGDGARERLAAAIQAAPVACVMLEVDAGMATRGAELSELLVMARAAGAVGLILDDAELARTLGADGVHLSAGDDAEGRYASARAAVGAQGALGVDAGGSRHVAMTAGELGAEYIAFSAPQQIGDSVNGIQARLDSIAWWAEIFEVPCVALGVTSPNDARDLAWAGADFVAVTLPTGRSPAWVAETMRAFAAALDEAARTRPE